MVRNIHHVHCWQLQDQDILFEAHIEASKDLLLSDSGKLVAETETMLDVKYHITHSWELMITLTCVSILP
jgi:cobalt-zinc-cadmium efflux system protein